MPRPARFTDDDVLDAALARVAVAGPQVTIADIAAQLGGPVGSIYYRFASRDIVLARLWMRSIQRFQAGLFELADLPDPHAALVAMAVSVPAYCRANPAEAVSLTLFRQERLLVECADEVRPAVAVLNDDLLALAEAMTQRRYGEVEDRHRHLVQMAVQLGPYGLVRPLLGGPIPESVDRAVEASADAILRLGD